ncbi:hypothetical protein NX722_11645 [Endozoicomonas gorgoniicola]|uniref:Uncharacterized protein n=1 Tax=Endozoicomonas gorgoniicola TaxID=1234144 RepID=A0ABT3MV82_9GAMM|nr:hypothetical protein [Endozoicomonas gorgoniicola]MCW7553280.1 hypothetical protein [Endozoicomonas gorgoniicola]
MENGSNPLPDNPHNPLTDWYRVLVGVLAEVPIFAEGAASG